MLWKRRICLQINASHLMPFTLAFFFIYKWDPLRNLHISLYCYLHKSYTWRHLTSSETSYRTINHQQLNYEGFNCTLIIIKCKYISDYLILPTGVTLPVKEIHNTLCNPKLAQNNRKPHFTRRMHLIIEW